MAIFVLTACSPPPQDVEKPAAAPQAAAAPDPALQAEREARLMKYASERCAPFGELAHEIMAARQAGVPMQKSLQLATDGGLAHHAELVIAAYEQPDYRSEGHRARAISEFESAAYLDCVKRITGR
jgi:hypothetical protein